MSEVGISGPRAQSTLSAGKLSLLTITLPQEGAKVKIPITYAPLRTAAARARTQDVGKLRGTL